MKKFFLISFSLCMAGCATVTRGTTSDVVINFVPENAKVTTSLGHSCSASPCELKISRKDEFSVTAEADGYQTQTIEVRKRVSAAGAAGAAGNVLIGGVIGVAVDGVTGATLEHTPNPVNIELVPAGEAPPEEIDAPNTVPTS